MHKHQCLKCTPDLIPDYDINSAFVHTREKCKTTYRVISNGKDVGWTHHVTKEGREGFYCFAGEDISDIHTCCGDTICIETRFGDVSVVHDREYSCNAVQI